MTDFKPLVSDLNASVQFAERHREQAPPRNLPHSSSSCSALSRARPSANTPRPSKPSFRCFPGARHQTGTETFDAKPGPLT